MTLNPRSSHGAPDVVDELRRQSRRTFPIAVAGLAIAVAALGVAIAALALELTR